jgi:hypothetical protein
MLEKLTGFKKASLVHRTTLLCFELAVFANS